MKRYFLILLFMILVSVFSLAQDEPISLTVTSSHISPIVGQRFRITASVINPAYESISGSLLVKGASGLTFFDPDAPIGTGNQWISGEQTLSGKGGQVQIRFDAIGNEEIKAPIEIIFSYKHGGEEKTTKKVLDINVRAPKCGDGKCEDTETSENCCEDCGCPKNYECKKLESDAKPRCYPKSRALLFLTMIVGSMLILIIIYKYIKKREEEEAIKHPHPTKPPKRYKWYTGIIYLKEGKSYNYYKGTFYRTRKWIKFHTEKGDFVVSLKDITFVSAGKRRGIKLKRKLTKEDSERYKKWK